MQILPQTAIDAARMCFNKRTPSPSHTAPLSLSVTDVYTLISQLWLNMCSPENFFAHKHIRDTISHPRPPSDVFIGLHPHIHTSALRAQRHVSQLITSPHAALSHGVTCQTFGKVRRDAPLSLFYQMWSRRLIWADLERRANASEEMRNLRARLPVTMLLRPPPCWRMCQSFQSWWFNR